MVDGNWPFSRGWTVTESCCCRCWLLTFYFGLDCHRDLLLLLLVTDLFLGVALSQ